MKTIEEIAETIKIKRKQSVLTQQELAEKSKVAVSTIRDLERGKLKDIKLSTIEKLYKTLKIK